LNEEITPAGELDNPAMLEIAEATYGRGAWRRELFEQRFSKGMKAYILRKAHKPASYLWVSEKSCEIYPVRLMLEIPEDVRYFFDEATGPDYRRQGMLGKLMRFAWAANSPRSVVIFVLADNQASQAANCRIGFRPVSTVSLTQIPPMRLQTVHHRKTGVVERFLSRPRMGANPFRLRYRLHSRGEPETVWLSADALNGSESSFRVQHGVTGDEPKRT
jgi:ribosomal protein S18 acetylase RimI-like enzyme